MIVETIDKLYKDPLVSVVIATYNQKKYIEETILSVLAQKCKFHYEIVIGDDCSNDGQRELLLDLQKKYPEYIRLVFNEKNLRVCRNYINAIQHSRGRYIATLDGDDKWIDEKKLEKQVNILENNDDISIVYTAYQSFNNETGKIVPCNIKWNYPCLYTKGQDSVSVFLNDIEYPLGSSALFRREEYLDGCRKYPELINDNIGEGTLLNASMAMAGKFYHLSDITVQYRVLQQSLSHFNSPEELWDFRYKYFTLRMCLAQLFSLNNRKLINKTYWEWAKIAIVNNEIDIFKSVLYKIRNNYKDKYINSLFFIYCNFITLKLFYLVGLLKNKRQ